MIVYSFLTHSYFHFHLLLIVVYLLLSASSVGLQHDNNPILRCFRYISISGKLIRRCHFCSHRTTSCLNNMLRCIAIFVSLLLLLLLLWLRYIASIIVVCSIDLSSSCLIQNQIRRFICLHTMNRADCCCAFMLSYLSSCDRIL